MALIPKYDVLPHGVVKDTSGVQAVFKMIVSIAKPADRVAVAQADWNQFANTINNHRWFWQYQSGSLTVSTDSSANPIDFLHRSTSSNLRRDRSFGFGREYIKNNEYAENFIEKIIQRGIFFWPGEKKVSFTSDVKRNTQQMGFDELPTTSIQALSAGTRVPIGSDPVVIGSHYDKILANARNKVFTAFTEESSYNLENIYGNLLDQPELAETFFGIVREFKIPIDKLITDDGEITYSISVDDTKDTSKNFLIRKQAGKYFNGLAMMFMVPGNHFRRVYANYSDPYNNYLNSVEQNLSHPDGIYMIVDYNSAPDNSIIDPFDSEVLKGFNVIVEKSKSIYSLSLHKKEISIAGISRKIEVKQTSGVMTPQADLETNDGKFRSNVLFAWRGDNLLVNRSVPSGEGGDETVLEDANHKENTLLGQLIDTRESLIPGSQLQLTKTDGSEDSYVFFARSVSPTGHHIPLKSELSLGDNCSLTVQDLPIDYLASFILKSVSFNVFQVDAIPIKSVTFRGHKSYANAGSDYVDSEQHLVLNKIKKERDEKRIIFPAHMKFEDFRCMSGLAVANLMKPGEKSEREFVNRCISYEDRAFTKSGSSKIPKYTTKIQSINYLADIRGKYLLFQPSDLSTVNLLPSTVVEAFVIKNKHPYYSQTRSCELTLQQLPNKLSSLTLRANIGLKTLYTDLADGIYNFKVYCTDIENVPNQPRLALYNGVDIRISIIDKSEESKLKFDPSTNQIAQRKLDTSKNRWYLSVPVRKNSRSWKSLKYLVKTRNFQLTHDVSQLSKLLSELGSMPPPLLLDEYPYDIFLHTSGANDINNSLYPKSLSLSIKAPSTGAAKKTPIYFKLRLNDHSTLTAHFKAGSIDLTIGETIFQLNYDTEETLLITFNNITGFYVIKHSDKIIYTLPDPIDPELSVNDIQVSDEVLSYIMAERKDYILNLVRSSDYQFIVDESDSFSKEKKINLLGSSAFQAYFPNATNEIELANPSPEFTVIIPNNTRPATPFIEAEVLFLQSNLDTGSLKENSVEQIIRLTVEADFMREGHNKLGVVLRKVFASEQNTWIELPTELGEDITKLTFMDWTDYNLETIIEFNHQQDVIKKYFSGSKPHYYEVDGETYSVLPCEPYYNTNIRKWQVLLPFKLFTSETLFLKISAIKIAPGHGLELKDRQRTNSDQNPFIDTTKTNFSKISKSIQLPIYNEKKVEVERRTIQGKTAFKIRLTSASVYENKAYYVMVKQRGADSLVNIQSGKEMNILSSYATINFHKNDADINPKTGKILLSSYLNDLIISIDDRVSGRSLVVMEFELHHNAPITGKGGVTFSIPTLSLNMEIPNKFPVFVERPTPRFEVTADMIKLKKMNLSNAMKNAAAPEFVNYNPLFDTRGIRLINMSEFNI